MAKLELFEMFAKQIKGTAHLNHTIPPDKVGHT